MPEVKVNSKLVLTANVTLVDKEIPSLRAILNYYISLYRGTSSTVEFARQLDNELAAQVRAEDR